MAERNLSLATRNEETREKQTLETVIEFSLLDIKKRFDETIADIESKFELYDSLLTAGNESSAKGILRSQIVFLESALDFYLHEISKYGFVNIFKGTWNKTERYNNFTIPMKSIEFGLKNPESSRWLIEYLNSRFSLEVYLSKESMKDQLNMLGLNFEPVINKAFPGRDGKKIISNLFERRNQIAHQSDRKHANAEQNDITKEYVVDCIKDVKILVETIQDEAIQKNT